MQILAISGSLRAASANTNLLKAAAAMTPEEVTLSLYDGLGDLPPFNPDVDKDPLHAAVAEFRSQLRQSAGVVFSTPEYAHGVPGVLRTRSTGSLLVASSIASLLRYSVPRRVQAMPRHPWLKPLLRCQRELFPRLAS